jgi:hypothetical protein
MAPRLAATQRHKRGGLFWAPIGGPDCAPFDRRPLKLHDESIRNTILAPKMEHSRKPDDVHERIERMYPQASKIELFARRARKGWDCWGNETPGLADNDNIGAAKGVAA